MAEEEEAAPAGAGRILAVAIGTGLGAGFFPFAPGTAGTLFPGVALYLGLERLGPAAVLIAAGALMVAGSFAAGACERVFRRKDPPPVVIDEVVGYLISVVGLGGNWKVVLAGFILFRVADILKPWPAGWIDRRVPGGPGVMLDDVVAGLYARGVLEITLRLFS